MSVEHKRRKDRRVARRGQLGDRARDCAVRAMRCWRSRMTHGHWLFELEADCTIPAEFILMMHFLDEIDVGAGSRSSPRSCASARPSTAAGRSITAAASTSAAASRPTTRSSWPVTIPRRRTWRAARRPILQHGGAARANVFTRMTLAMFGQVPWRGVPYIPVEIMLLPKWFPFHLDKVSYWSRTVMVPLFVLCTRRVVAKNPRAVDIRELFTVAPELERNYFRRARFRQPAVPAARSAWTRASIRWSRAALRARAIARAEQWINARGQRRGRAGRDLSRDGQCARGDGDCSAIRPMIRAACWPRMRCTSCWSSASAAAYCQPCVSPVWDTALSCLALQEEGSALSRDALARGLEWLRPLQLLEADGDWRQRRPHLRGGGWAFQFDNSYYPDLDDTAAVAWAMHACARSPSSYASAISARARLAGRHAERERRLCRVRCRRHLLLPERNSVRRSRRAARSADRRCHRTRGHRAGARRARAGPAGARARHRLPAREAGAGAAPGSAAGAPTTSTAPGRCWWRSRRPGSVPRIRPCAARWPGWPAASRPTAAGARAMTATWMPIWRARPRQHAVSDRLGAAGVDGGRRRASRRCCAAACNFCCAPSRPSGLWEHPSYTAPGFPRVFYLKYHGYCAYFPLWALARYRRLVDGGKDA